MSAPFSPITRFWKDIIAGLHHFPSDECRILLTASPPSEYDEFVNTVSWLCVIGPQSCAQEIPDDYGYTRGGVPVRVEAAEVRSRGVPSFEVEIRCAPFELTASGPMAPFQYAALYNNVSGTTDRRPLFGWWNIGNTVHLVRGDTFHFGHSGTHEPLRATFNSPVIFHPTEIPRRGEYITSLVTPEEYLAELAELRRRILSERE